MRKFAFASMNENLLSDFLNVLKTYDRTIVVFSGDDSRKLEALRKSLRPLPYSRIRGCLITEEEVQAMLQVMSYNGMTPMLMKTSEWYNNELRKMLTNETLQVLGD